MKPGNSTLLDSVGKHAFQEVGVRELIICTENDDNNPAKNGYKSYGFTDGVPSYGLFESDTKK
jgi:hypothetical protein